MGCDIHAVVAVRREYKSTAPVWDAVMTFYEPRDYSLFHAMAGVRYPEVPTVAEPRGLPENFHVDKDKGEPEVWVKGKVGLGDHTYSWLTPDEFAEAIRRAETWDGDGNWGGPRDPEYYAALAFMREMEKHYPAVAIIFGFDS